MSVGSPRIMIRIELIRDERDFQALRESWNSLARASGLCTVFARHEWFDASWRWCGLNGTPLIICVHRDESLIGVLPLLQSTEKQFGMALQKLEYLSVPDCQASDLICAKTDEQEVSGAIASQLASSDVPWDVMEIDKLSDDSVVARSLRQRLAEHGLRSDWREESGNPGISLQCTWDEFYSRRSRRLKKGNNNIANRLRRDGGECSIERFSGDTADFNSAMRSVIELSAKSWKRDTGLTFDNPGPRAFIERLTEHAKDLGWLSIWQLEIEGKPVATEYQIVYEGRIHALRSDYDPEYESLSPGTYLNWKMLERLFSEDEKFYSMGPGDNPYKLRWAEEIEPQSRLVVRNATMKGGYLTFLNDYVRPVARRLRRERS